MDATNLGICLEEENGEDEEKSQAFLVKIPWIPTTQWQGREFWRKSKEAQSNQKEKAHLCSDQFGKA